MTNALGLASYCVAGPYRLGHRTGSAFPLSIFPRLVSRSSEAHSQSLLMKHCVIPADTEIHFENHNK